MSLCHMQAELARELRAAAKAVAENSGSNEEDTSEDEGMRDGKAAPAQKSSLPAAAEDDEAAMKDIMMTRKTKKFYERVQRAQQGKRERVEELEARKQALKRRK